MSVKRKVINLLPEIVKVVLKNVICIALRLIVYRSIAKPLSSGQALTDINNSTFFGYHDKTPFSLDGKKILAMSVVANDTLAENECTEMKIGYFTKSTQDDFESKFITLSQTSTWCWQQGCMLQWNPVKPDREIVFNALVNGDYGARVFDVIEQKKVREYAHPIYSISPCGKLATTLNFSRLGRLRPGYGYALFPDETKENATPDDDGLFLLDMQTGVKTLLISIRKLADDINAPGAEHYINHVTFSSDGRRLTFFHLWTTGQSRNVRFCEANLYTGEFRVLEGQRIVSHYCWRNPDELLATTMETSGKWHYTLYNLANDTRTSLNLPFERDGHPMFCPSNKDLIVTDSYPDKCRDQKLYLANIKTGEVTELATLYSPFRYRGQVRCDLHPRWDRDGSHICFDSTVKGHRSMYILEVPDWPK